MESKHINTTTPGGTKKSITKLVALFLGLIIMISCNTNKKELERLEQEKLALQEQIDANSENVAQYFEDLNEIEENLKIIKQKENLISSQASGDVELGVSQQELINKDIKVIGELMEKNRQLIANLNRRLRNADTRIKGFEETITRLNSTIEEKEIEIALMRDQLANMNLQVELLTSRIGDMEKEDEEKSRQIEMQTQELNTAWYAVGSKTELTENKILTVEGGFLGIGRRQRLNGDFNRDFFTRIDITRVSQITLNGEKPEILSTHPADSYEIVTVDGETFLEIKKPDTFWSTTHYLVVQVK